MSLLSYQYVYKYRPVTLNLHANAFMPACILFGDTSLNPLAKEFSLERKLTLYDLNPYAPMYIPLNSRRFDNSLTAITTTVLIIPAFIIHEIHNNENLELSDITPKDT